MFETNIGNDKYTDNLHATGLFGSCILRSKFLSNTCFPHFLSIDNLIEPIIFIIYLYGRLNVHHSEVDTNLPS